MSSITITNVATGLNLDLDGANGANGTRMLGKPALEFLASQQFTTVPINGTNNVYIRNIATGAVLDLDSGNAADGTKAQGYDCINNDRNQYWLVVPYIGNQVALINNASGTALSLNSNNQAVGVNYQAGDEHQRWIFKPVCKSYTITNVATGLRLDVDDGNSANGTKMVGRPVLESSTLQQYAIMPMGRSNFVYIRNMAFTNTSNKVLDLDSGKVADGTKVQIWDINSGNRNQYWFVVHYLNDQVALVNGVSCTALSMNTNNEVVCNKLVASDDCQRWILKPAC